MLLWDVVLVVMADTGVVAVGATEAAASKTKLVGEGVTVANGLDVAVLLVVVAVVSLVVAWVADGLLWSLQSIKVVGIGEDTDENALASADTDGLAVTMVEKGLIVFIFGGRSWWCEGRIGCVDTRVWSRLIHVLLRNDEKNELKVSSRWPPRLELATNSTGLDQL